MEAMGRSPPSVRRRRQPSRFRHGLNRWVHKIKWAALRRIFRGDIAAIQSKLSAEPFAVILGRYPDIPLKPVRPYLTGGLNRRHRRGAVIGHYAAAARLLTDAAVVSSHTGGQQLLSVSTAEGEVTVELTGQDGLYREAEWRLLLRLDGRPITEMGLAIVDRPLLRIDGEGQVLWIGALKSASAGVQGLDDARILTKAMEGLRPKSLLLLVAQALARSLDLSGLVAASNAGHVFASDHSLRRRISADYDSFWVESGGSRVRRIMFDLPITKAQRDPAEYKPNKRAQVRRRHHLELEIARRVAEAIRPMRRT
ncbi:DUF535 family protein [Mesorhizobium sp. AR07]|uniref:VirK/YbjX family protein n=1 Tax=Mesorhizobium sp. AR07 TaxID=2865838 RepID=UPI002160BFDD|nr:DUF535 family protein [Mesorhizobium sp. AR07]UVK43019.1 DUF535 family protein [Mesorhizobium sp. AR07]